jgi:hypothetical protein
MKILILVESPSESNSAYHVVNIAVQLSKLGHQVKVLFDLPEEGRALHILKDNGVLSGSLGDPSEKIDILYGWGARRKIRLMTKLYKFEKLVVHMEDNDFLIARDRYPQKFANECNEIDAFIARAAFVTAVNRNCQELIPRETPFVLLTPGVDDIFFEAKIVNRLVTAQTNKKGNYLLFTGNVTEYVLNGLSAIASAIEAYNKTNKDLLFLFVTGRDWTESLKKMHPNSVLIANFLDRKVLSELMNHSLANVQCSAAQEFDRYRFPSKIPEYLISESIILTTPFEIEFRLADRENCVLVEDMKIENWLVCINYVMNMSRDERTEIIRRAGVQAREKLNWSSTALNLHEAFNWTSPINGTKDRFNQDKLQ